MKLKSDYGKLQEIPEIHIWIICEWLCTFFSLSSFPFFSPNFILLKLMSSNNNIYTNVSNNFWKMKIWIYRYCKFIYFCFIEDLKEIFFKTWIGDSESFNFGMISAIRSKTLLLISATDDRPLVADEKRKAVNYILSARRKAVAMARRCGPREANEPHRLYWWFTPTWSHRIAYKIDIGGSFLSRYDANNNDKQYEQLSTVSIKK